MDRKVQIVLKIAVTLMGSAVLVVSLPWVCFVLLWIFIAPFTGFTFTDAVDFGPVVVLVASFAALALRHWCKPHSLRWIATARISAFLFAALPPFLCYGALYMLALRAQVAIGHWPCLMIDDPKYIAVHNVAYQQMRHVVAYAEAFAGTFVWIWVALVVHLRRRLTRMQWVALILLFYASWLLYVSSDLFAWWLD